MMTSRIGIKYMVDSIRTSQNIIILPKNLPSGLFRLGTRLGPLYTHPVYKFPMDKCCACQHATLHRKHWLYDPPPAIGVGRSYNKITVLSMRAPEIEKSMSFMFYISHEERTSYLLVPVCKHSLPVVAAVSLSIAPCDGHGRPAHAPNHQVVHRAVVSCGCRQLRRWVMI